jgi:quercetin dioxygenase-like cupin family protein
MKNLGMIVLAMAIGLLAGNAPADDSEGIRFEELTKTGNSWDGTPLPAYPDSPPEITIMRITIPAGASLPRHAHPVINAGVLLSGELTVIAEDNQTLYLKAGDPIVEVVNKMHYGKNHGKEPAVILMIYAGTPGTPISVKKGVEVSTGKN